MTLTERPDAVTAARPQAEAQPSPSLLAAALYLLEMRESVCHACRPDAPCDLCLNSALAVAARLAALTAAS